MDQNNEFDAPPTNFSTDKHATHGFSSRLGLAQATAYFTISLTICIYFICLQYLYQNLVLLSLFVIFGLIMLISSAVATLTNPTDRMIYYYKASIQDRTIQFKPDYQKIVFCDHCDSYCYATSKHCRSCNRCAEEFDHHCMWLNNCIGKRNYKSFFVSIIATFAFIAVFLIHGAIMSVSMDYQQNFKLGRAISSWIMMAILAVFQFLLANLILLHIYLNWTGQTTYYFLKRKQKEEEQQQSKNKEGEKLRNQSGAEFASKISASYTSVGNTFQIEVVPAIHSKQNKQIDRVQEIYEKQSQINLNLMNSRTISKDTAATNQNKHQDLDEKKEKSSQYLGKQEGKQIQLIQPKQRRIKKLPSFLVNNRSLNLFLDSNEAQSPSTRIDHQRI